MLSIYLLRHGETELSRQDRFCGHIDAPLDTSGRQMAACFADAYGDLPWRAVISSTRSRAVSMAEPLATRTGIPVRRDRRLDEMFFGEWQGLSKAEAAARDPELYLAWRRDPTLGPPGGESPFEVYARVSAMVDDLRARHGEGNVLIVSHKVVLRLLLCRLLQIPLSEHRTRFHCPVGSVSILDEDKAGMRGRVLGDTSYLPLELCGAETPTAIIELGATADGPTANDRPAGGTTAEPPGPIAGPADLLNDARAAEAAA